MTSAGRALRGAVPWWLDGGEYCGHCHQGYVREAEYRCGFCDGAMCGHCAIVVHETVAVHCRDCGTDSAGGADGTEGG